MDNGQQTTGFENTSCKLPIAYCSLNEIRNLKSKHV